MDERVRPGDLDAAVATITRTVTALDENSALVVAELASNAVPHGAVPGRDALLCLTLADGRLRIEVTDTRGERHPSPAPTTIATDCETGLGLLIVDTLAEAWGVTLRTGAPGKTVWAVLPLDGTDGTST